MSNCTPREIVVTGSNGGWSECTVQNFGYVDPGTVYDRVDFHGKAAVGWDCSNMEGDECVICYEIHVFFWSSVTNDWVEYAYMTAATGSITPGMVIIKAPNRVGKGQLSDICGYWNYVQNDIWIQYLEPGVAHKITIQYGTPNSEGGCNITLNQSITFTPPTVAGDPIEF
jgi:hypothetical protein